MRPEAAKPAPAAPPAGDCPVCGKVKPDVYKHAKQRHTRHRWTLDEAKSIGAFACGCGTLVRNATNGIPKHRSKAGCVFGLPNGGDRCPVCDTAQPDLFMHAKRHHADHRWTLDAARSIGAFACACGTLVRNETHGLAGHYNNSGCREGYSVYIEAQRGLPQRAKPLQGDADADPCPICGLSQADVYYHAKTRHTQHHWTLDEAKSIGGYACHCGVLVRNAGNCLARHQSGPRCHPFADETRPTKRVRNADESKFGLCPVCCKNRTSDVYQHVKMVHPGYFWTLEEATSLGFYACACGTLVRNATYGVRMHRSHTGCTQGLSDIATSSAPVRERCPICGQIESNIYHHGRTEHSGHRWTLLEALSIGAFACDCGQLVRNDKWGMTFHRNRTGCRQSVREEVPPPEERPADPILEPKSNDLETGVTQATLVMPESPPVVLNKRDTHFLCFVGVIIVFEAFGLLGLGFGLILILGDYDSMMDQTVTKCLIFVDRPFLNKNIFL